MRLTNKEKANAINKLARLKAKMRPYEVEAEHLTATLLRQGGGESSKWRADIVAMPAKIMKVRAHDQLRLYPK